MKVLIKKFAMVFHTPLTLTNRKITREVIRQVTLTDDALLRDNDVLIMATLTPAKSRTSPRHAEIAHSVRRKRSSENAIR